jgi:hypothetical protein
LHGALAYRSRPSAPVLGAALLAAFAAMASKEIGLVATAALILVWLPWAAREPRMRRQALLACAAALACAIAFLVWRAVVLGTAGSGLLGGTPLATALGAGLGAWLRNVGGYLSYATQWTNGQRIGVVVAAVGLAMACVFSLRTSKLAQSSARPAVRRTELVIAGLCLLLLPAVLQAPVAMLNAAPLRAGFSAIEAAMQSRLYYLGLAGAALLLGAWLASLRGVAHALACASVALALGVFGVASHSAAEAFAQRSVAISGIARAAVDAVDAAAPALPCRFLFLGVEQAPEWGGFVSMDSIVKALAQRKDVAHCWIHADAPTYFHLQSAEVVPADAAPWTPLRVDGVVVPWLRLGALAIAYVSSSPAPAAQAWADARVLRWHAGRFDAVGDVADHRPSMHEPDDRNERASGEPALHDAENGVP